VARITYTSPLIVEYKPALSRVGAIANANLSENKIHKTENIPKIRGTLKDRLNFRPFIPVILSNS
jgi:hypothetical protein